MGLPDLDPAPSPRDLVVAKRVKGLGPWKDIDPRKPGRLWTRWHVAGLAFWALVTGGALAKAWHHHGGLPQRPTDD